MAENTEVLGDYRQRLILNVIKFLSKEAEISSPEKKESLEVAIQCLEAAFSVDYSKQIEAVDQYDELLSLFDKKDATPEAQEAAEGHKIKGNDLMRNGLYKEAVEEYSRAINYNSRNAVYYCNRAAAYSRLENHEQALADSKKAVKLDPNYGKAYGRLGIAYSNLNMFNEAKEAYNRALSLDPTNSTYSENLKLAERQLQGGSVSGEGAASNVNLSDFMNNPSLLNVASQMLNDPGVRNMMSGLLNVDEAGNPNIDSLLQMGQQLAQQMQINNPGFVDNLRRQFSDTRGNNDQPDSDNNKNDGPSNSDLN